MKNNMFVRVMIVLTFVSVMLTRYAFDIPDFIDGILIGILIALVLILMFPKMFNKIKRSH